ncbi:TonB-dependent receptor [Sphingomonas sp. AR_OL41]|uniref:TonB-dependent receptor n=1 Tax=Sphingomonas sp. AR_OL41 TaxID=3042729 RepID=UPI00248091EE|nr:TonB-dependent receptor [Sphingomonas sp. AR_OL41]MDH7973254.1 TonB-dependent receptor [Sphingomonas sp. AR_OL41]
MRNISTRLTSGKRTLLCGAAAFVSILPLAAAAQTAAATDTAASPDGDVVVTARNRTEKLQDVPLAITSFSSQDLTNANVRNLRDVAYLTPGLSVTSGGSEFGVNPVIRGQTNLNGGAGDPNVAVFIDGVYISNNTAINVGLIDLERVEVVKGPVSSLYGRNAFAGAINYVSKKPSLAEPHGRVTAFAGNDGQYSLAGAMSYPLVKDVLAVSVAAGYEHFDGSYRDQTTGARAGGFIKRDIQGTVYFTPSSAFSLMGSYYYGNDKFGGSAIAYNVNNCGTRANPVSPLDPSGLGFSQFCGHFDSDAHAVEVPVINQAAGQSGNSRRVNLARLNMSYDMGFAKLTSLTGFVRVTQQRLTDFIGRSAGIPFTLVPGPGVIYLPELFGSNTNSNDFSEELRLQTPADKPFRLQLGGFFFSGKTFSTTLVTIDGTTLPAGQTLTAGFPANSLTSNGQLDGAKIVGQTLSHDRQYSAFIGADYDILTGLTASGEYRYTHQRKDQLVIRTTGCASTVTTPTASCNGTAPTAYLYPNGPNPVAGSFNFSNFRASLKYQASPGMNFYVSVANGTKAGGFNQRAVAAADGSQPDLKFDPEKNMTYEVGMKNSLFGNRLQLNIALYHINTKGIQISGPSSVPTNPGLVTKNFGSVHTDGFEVELAAKLAQGVRVRTGVAYADPRFGKDAFDFGAAGACASSNVTTGVITPIIPQCAGRVVILPANSQYNNSNFNKAALSLNGLHVPRETNFQFTAGLDLDGAIGDSGWKWTATYNARYEAKQYAFNNNISWYGGRTVMNLRVGVENPTYSISAYVNNLTNDHTPEIVSVNARLSDFGGDLDGYLPVGRQFGVTVGAKF